MLSPRVAIVPWLQKGWQDRLAGSVSIEEFVALWFEKLNTLRICIFHMTKQNPDFF
jgi:hypothetical protein